VAHKCSNKSYLTEKNVMLKVCDHMPGPVLPQISNCSSFSLSIIHSVITVTDVYIIYIFSFKPFMENVHDKQIALFNL
jgi:hypothetical protein